MGKYLKLFENHTQYETYINGSDAILPNVSICTTEGDVYYNPYVPETRVVAKYNVTSTSSPTKIGYNQYTSGFSEIEIDGVVQTAVTSAYTFDTAGEHTVKYTLTDPTSIGNYAFDWCGGLTSIVIPNSVTSIGYGAFQYCTSLTSIDIPSGVTAIINWTFQGCSSLRRLNSDVDGVFNIPSGVTSIANQAFESCSSLTSCTIGSGVTSIGNYVFQNCSGLTSCTIGSGVTSIGREAFYGCSGLTSIVSNATTAPTIQSSTFQGVKTNGTLRVPIGSSGYDVWMGTSNYYLGLYNWTKVEQ